MENQNSKKHGPIRGNKNGEHRTEYVPKGSKPHQKNYKELHLEELDVLDKESLKSILEQNNYDMDKSINQLIEFTGKIPAEIASTKTDSSNSSTSIKEISGDLFSCGDASLAHCVSVDLKMGKGITKKRLHKFQGIAVEFKKRFGGVSELQKQGKVIGETAILQQDGNFIYYLITKLNYWNKPTYESLKSSLVAMKEHAVSKGVKRICMPRIGCGLDGLLWNKVKQIIGEVFAETGIEIEVYSL